MKNFFVRVRKTLAWQAIQSGMFLSLLIYLMLRTMFYEFPMTWSEEIAYFFKTILVSTIFISLCTGGMIYMYRGILKMRHWVKNVN